MKLGITNITRLIVFLMALAVLAVCGILFPELAREEAVGKVNPPSPYPFLLSAWILAIPVLTALYQMLKLLNYMDQNNAFSYQSVKALRNIKYSSVIFSVLIVVGAATVIIIAKIEDPAEDVTPVVTFGFIFTFVSSVIATFTAVLQNLLQSAIDMKAENELTV